MVPRAFTVTGIPGQILYDDGAVSLCFLVNRRSRMMRVVDYRSGPHSTKGVIVWRLAREQEIERVFTLVERDEVATWSRYGFQREGTIPGFFKRTDAWVLGASAECLPPAADDQSGMRRVPTDDHDPTADRTLAAAKRVTKGWADLTPPAVRVQPAQGPLLDRLLGTTTPERTCSEIDAFGKDCERIHFHCTGRGGFSLPIAVELQACYSNALLDLLSRPRTEKESLLAAMGLGLVCNRLAEGEIASAFAIAPVDDVELASVFLANRFRKTGLLRAHLVRVGRRQDAILWTRRLLGPTDS